MKIEKLNENKVNNSSVVLSKKEQIKKFIEDYNKEHLKTKEFLASPLIIECELSNRFAKEDYFEILNDYEDMWFDFISKYDYKNNRITKVKIKYDSLLVDILKNTINELNNKDGKGIVILKTDDKILTNDFINENFNVIECNSKYHFESKFIKDDIKIMLLAPVDTTDGKPILFLLKAKSRRKIEIPNEYKDLIKLNFSYINNQVQLN